VEEGDERSESASGRVRIGGGFGTRSLEQAREGSGGWGKRTALDLEFGDIGRCGVDDRFGVGVVVLNVCLAVVSVGSFGLRLRRGRLKLGIYSGIGCWRHVTDVEDVKEILKSVEHDGRVRVRELSLVQRRREVHSLRIVVLR